MLTQIWNAHTDIIFCHFRPFFALLRHCWPRKLKFGKNAKKTPGDIILLQMWTINQDDMIHGSWDMKFNRQNVFVIMGNFFPFYHPPPHPTTPPQTARKIKITKNHDHMLYCSWDMVRDGSNCYFLFWAILFPFASLTAPKKWKIQNNEKKAWRYYFTQVYQK